MSQAQNVPPPPRFSNLWIHITANKIDLLISITRLVTVVTTVFFVFPVFETFNRYSFYQKSLISSAATCALRLHQRWPRFQLNYQFLSLLAQEDSAHYLIFSIVFLLTSGQLTLVLLPITLFAIINLLTFFITRFQSAGLQDHSTYVQLTSFKSSYQPYMLQMVALAEITLLPITMFGVLTGTCQLVTPLIYSRFLIYRYASRRNPYTRLMFTDLKFTLQRAIYSPSCPIMVRNLTNQMITFISRFAPNIDQSQ